MKRLLAALALLLALAAPAAAMQKRTANVTDQTGRVIPNATVTVYVSGTATPATIYSDNGVNLQVNPIVVNPTDGSYTYYAASGRYTEVIAASGFTFTGGQTTDVLLYDPEYGKTTSLVGAAQTNYVDMFNAFSPIGTTQQVGGAFTITGSASTLLGSSSYRIGLYAGAETRGGGENVMALNLSVFNRSADPVSQVIAAEIDISSNKQDAPSTPVAGQQVGGVSIVSTGGHSADWGLTIGGTGKYQKGIYVNPQTIVSAGQAFYYGGDGTNGLACLRSDSTLELGFCSSGAFGNPNEVHIANNRFYQGLNQAGNTLVPIASINTSNKVSLDPNGTGAVFGGVVQYTGFVFANIGTALTINGQVGYCSDCTIANPCAGGGNGAIAKRLNGANVCN